MEEEASVLGTWRLKSFQELRGETMIDVFGSSARGFITYGPEGYMSALIAGGDRKRFRGAWKDIPPREKADSFDALVAYAGRYSFSGDRVTHHVEVSWIPNWEGRDLVRDARFIGKDCLELRTVPDLTGQPLQILIWERVG